MTIKSGKQQKTESVPVVWYDNIKTKPPVAKLAHKNIAYYNKCLCGALTISVGDYVLVLNTYEAQQKPEEGCDVAKVLYLYELRESSKQDTCRALVQWYTRPELIPQQHYDTDELTVDFQNEIIEDHRPYENDISLESVFRKCSVICGPKTISAVELLEPFKNKRNTCAMFVCRYKFVRSSQKHYELVPLQFEQAQEPETPAEKRRRRASQTATNGVEFLDMAYFSNEAKVSPIRIVGGRSVVRMSQKTPSSPLSEVNDRVTPKSRAATAKRNLNISLGVPAETMDTDCLNYSIVKSTGADAKAAGEIKIKLRVSQRATRKENVDIDPLTLPIDKGLETPKRASTPSTYENSMQQSSPAIGTRRRSILKSATNRMADGTPKRSILLSNHVEKRVYNNEDAVCTPKRTRLCESSVETLKTPQSTRTRRRPMVYDVDEDEDDDYVPYKRTPSKRTPSNKLSTKSTPKSKKTPVKKTPAKMTASQCQTPSQKMRAFRAGEICPALEERQTPSSRRKSNFQLAGEQLHVSIVPKSLPCREKEFANVYTFLRGKIEDECGGCMYVSGVPGTGKTATVTSVIRVLQREMQQNELPAFEFLEINGMRLTEPRQAYVNIYRQLTGKTLPWEQAHMLLEKRFSNAAPRRLTTVLLVDELDILCNRRQDVVYNLLDWPTKSVARLVVVTIANTMDLPERLLMGKVTSRLGLTRLTFQPYTHKQLQEIVSARLSGCGSFKNEAIQLVARKVAAVSGDARRALDICRRATEIADVQGTAMQVNMLHVQEALTEMIASAKVQAIKSCSRMEQLFLEAMTAESMRTGVEETIFMRVYTQVETIAALQGLRTPTVGQMLRICSQLGSRRLIICEHSRNDIFQKLLLNVSMDDIHYALQCKPDAE